MRKEVVLASLFSVIVISCKTQHECRPGTLFVRASLDNADGQADSLQVRLQRTDHPDDNLTPFTRHVSGAGVESFEISFGTYMAGSTVTLQVVALAHGTPVGSTTQSIKLTAGCTSAELNVAGFTALTDLGMSTDMNMGGSGPIDMNEGTPDMAHLAGTPDAPAAITATAKPGGIVALSWTAPADNGSPITGYTIQSNPPGFMTTTSALSANTSALTPGTSYKFDVQAKNDVGPGAVGTSMSVVAGDVPAAPSGVHATANGLSATVTWNAPSANGYPITGYTVVADNGGATVKTDATTTMATFSGLGNGQQYKFTVTAKNDLGVSAPSTASNAITASCVNTAYSIFAVDMTTVQYVGDANASAISYIEARHDSRPSPFVNRDTTGWALFHLPDPPNGPPSTATVVSLQLTMNVSSTISNPAPSLVEVWYSQDDGWRSSSVLTSSDVRRTQKVSHSPVPPGAAGTKLSIDLDVPPTTGAWNWATDLVDRNITVGIANADLTDQLSYVRFLDASAGAQTVPLLKITVCQ